MFYSQVSIVHTAPSSHPSAPGTLPVGQTTTATAATAENSQVSSQVLLESSHASLPTGMIMAGAEVAHRFSSGQQQPSSPSAHLSTTGLCKGIELKNNNQGGDSMA